MSYVLAIAAAVLYGGDTVLQATAARRAGSVGHLDPKLFLRLAKQWAFIGSLLLGGLGVLCTGLALRHLPLFVVQATLASSVGVTAVLAARVHHEPLSRPAKIGLVAIVGGLGVLAFASDTQGPPKTALSFRITLLAVAVAGLVLTRLAARRPAPWSAIEVGALGAMAGGLYGVSNVALRVVRDFHPVHLVADPGAWAVVVGGFGGVLVLAVALQRGSVAVAAGSMTIAETLIPTIIGLAALGERPRAGWAGTAAIGFGLAVLGALALVRDAAQELATAELATVEVPVVPIEDPAPGAGQPADEHPAPGQDGDPGDPDGGCDVAS